MIPPKMAYKNTRRRGCPKNGRLTFTAKQVAALPPIASLRTIARVLGISQVAARQWTNKRQLNRLPFEIDESYKYKNGLHVIRSEVLIQWLKDTGRYVKRKKR